MSAQSSGRTPQSNSFTPSRTLQIDDSIPLSNAEGMIEARDRQTSHDTSHQNAGGDSATLSNDEAYNSGELRIDRRRSKAPQTVNQSASTEPAGEAARDKRGTTNGIESKPASTGSRRPPHYRQHSVGSSPLAQEVVNSQQADVDVDRITAAAASLPNTIESTPSSSSRNGPTTATQSNSSEKEKKRSAIGYDTDPAQIVNLALNLSESRRRNISGGGFLLPGLPYSNSGGSLRQHLQQQRYASGNTSPRSRNTSGSPRVISTSSRQRKSTPIHSPSAPMLSEQLGDDHILVPSDATLTRAAKAKEAFELFYEYRRLLPHLSAIPVSARKGSSGSTRALSPTRLGRVYNPLQYVRNRRIRLSERKPLNAEAAGWRDVARVRNWVDRIIDEREDDSIAHDQQTLPPFEGEQLEAAASDGADSSGVIAAKVPHTQHVGRPNIDWTFSPWHLLADVRWLEEDDHLKRIRDSSGQNIFAQMVNHADASPRMSKESTRERRPHTNASGFHHSPERRQAIAVVRNQERQMPNSKGSSPSSPMSERGRKGRWTRGFIRSREPSLSDDSDAEQRRKLKRNNKRADREHSANLALEKQMMDMLAREEEEAQRDPRLSTNSATQENSPKALGQEKVQNSLPTPERRRPSGPQRLKTDMPVEKHISPPRSSFDERRFEQTRMSSDDFSTGPSSPTANGFVPSIAINFSPPRSPNSTAIVPKPFAKAAPLRRGRSPSGSTTNVDKHDFAAAPRLSVESSRSNIGNVQSSETDKIERTVTTESRLLSPIKTITGSKKPRLHESHSFRSLKDLNEPEGDSKFRSFLKGGRLAELVGNQVARAGEILWKKEGTSGVAVDSPTASHASTDSDVDDADLSALDNSPSDLSRVTTNADGHGKLTRMTTSSDTPKYFMNNLPSFRSPYRDEGPDKSPKSSPALDPISRQQRDRKERSRSSRFDRLAPPKIDMRSVSPSPSPSDRRARSTSSRESSSASVNRSRSRLSSHSMLNDMLGIPGQASTFARMPAPTGLASFKAQTESSSQRPQLEGNRQWSISNRSMSTAHGPVSKRDIARIRALMLSSGVKANEITRRSEETPKKPSKLVQDLGNIIDGPLPCVPASQEHVTAARMLIRFIESTNDSLHEAEKQFACATVQNLSRDIGAIEQRINASLSPMVRESADGADALSIEVTTTHTLAVKQIGDRIDLILRRRRQTSRWLRRGGWAMLEWAVLGIMWMVWFVVVIIRIIRGTITGVIGAEHRDNLNFFPRARIPTTSSLLERIGAMLLRPALRSIGRTNARSIGARSLPQWPTTRQALFYPQASIQNPPPETIEAELAIRVLPGTASSTASQAQPIPPPISTPLSPTPATPTSNITIPPENVPKVPPPPGAKIQTAPPTSLPSSSGPVPTASSSPPPPPPPPPPPKRKSGRFRRFFLTLFLLGGLSYAGGVYYSLVSDNFHDFFTEYVPFGEDAVLYFEEREYRKRFPNITSPTNRPLVDGGHKVTIPSRSGVSWKVADEGKGSDLRTNGAHRNATGTKGEAKDADKENAQRTPSQATGKEKVKAVESVKEDRGSSAGASKSSDQAPKAATSQKSAESTPPSAPKQTESARPASPKTPEVNEPSIFMPIEPIDPLKIRNANEPLVQDLVKILNDIITVVNNDGSSHKYNSTIRKAKEALASVGGRILSLKRSEQQSARNQIASMQSQFDTGAKELISRLESEMRAQEGRWRDGFDSEREKLSASYEYRLESETKRAQEVMDARQENALLEQSLVLKKQFLSQISDRVESERDGRLAKLGDLSSSVDELEKLTADWNAVIDANLRTQHLQVAVEAVRNILEKADRPRPFVRELAALKEIGADDPVIDAAIASINPTAYQRGIPIPAQLIDRFRRVAGEVRKASLLPDDAGVASHAASVVMSKFLFKKKGMTVGDDVESILTRTETLLEEGNLDEAAREMNTLDGWAKTLSWDWLSECRRVLEVRQAMDVIATEARLEGLKVDK